MEGMRKRRKGVLRGGKKTGEDDEQGTCVCGVCASGFGYFNFEVRIHTCILFLPVEYKLTM